MSYANCPFDIEPYERSEPILTTAASNLNYTNQDFWSLKTRLMDYIRHHFGDKFNDFVEGDLAIMLIENWAFIADTLSFKIDQIANEIFIDTVTELENAFRLAKLVGFKPQPPIASRCWWTATISGVLTQDLVIPPGVLINLTSNNEQIAYELFPADSSGNPLFDRDIIISAGNFSNNSIIGLEGRTITDQFSGTGQTGQTFQLSISPVIWNSIQVEVNGTKWREVDFFTDSSPRPEYRVEFNSQWQAFIVFGNSRSGLIPSRGDQIRVTYRSGGGARGNIVSGAATIQRSFFAAGLEITVPVTFNNYTRGEYGYDGDTIDDIRNKIPAYLRLQDRCVSGLDYKTFSEQFATPYNGQVGKATAVLRNYGCAANIVDIYILARDQSSTGDDELAEPSNELKASLSAQLKDKKMLTDKTCLRDGYILNVDIHIDILLDKFYRKSEEEIRIKIQRRVNSFFNINEWNFGDTLKDTDLIKSLSDVREIKSIEITFIVPTDEDNSGQIVTSDFYEIIRPGDLTLNFTYQ